jgi:hypothetical protein
MHIQSNGHCNIRERTNNDEGNVNRIVIAVQVFLGQDIHRCQKQSEETGNSHCEAVKSPKGNETAKD